MQAGKITWESRREKAKGTFSFHLQRPYVLVEFDEVRECTWLGSTPCAASGGNSTGVNTWESRENARGSFISAAIVVFDEVRKCTWLSFFYVVRDET